VVSREGGRELVALLVNGKANKVEVVRLNENGVVHRFGNVSVKPGEADDSLGLEARSLAVDNDGNIWVATDAWGQTSVFLAGPDGQPSEQTVDGRKGAVKKYAPDGRLLGVVSMLQAPMALKTAEANGKPVVLVSYRHVSSYHGAQVREGVVAISVAEIKRVGEIKVPAGSLDVDGDGHIWVGDVAGHVSCHTHEGSKILDLAGSPEAAVPDSQLPSGSPLPAAVRCDGEATVWVLYTLQKELVGAKTDGTDQTSGQRVPDDAGVLHQLKMIGQSPVAVGEAGCWKR
jgi:hypothetical protein